MEVRGEEFHHSVRVVRLRAGEEVELFDGAGSMASGRVESIDRDHAVIVTGDPLPSRESPLAIHLAMSIIQLDRFELVLQKVTELGVRSIIPMVTDRVELRRERYAGKAERWERIIFEAVRQSGRGAPPRLAGTARFEEILALRETKVLFDADSEAGTLSPADDFILMIGPEGGWSEEEIERARAARVTFQRLGPRRLRAETAAIAAVAVITSRFGDL
jgi:16S rRNA (uracil1498-N3)-methyltransferase